MLALWGISGLSLRGLEVTKVSGEDFQNKINYLLADNPVLLGGMLQEGTRLAEEDSRSPLGSEEGSSSLTFRYENKN